MVAPGFLLSKHYRLFTLVVFFLKVALAESNFSSFSFSKFGKDSNFESTFELYGGAKVVNGGNAVQLTDSVGSGLGRVTYKKPIKLAEGKPKKLVYFSTNFSFSAFPGNGDGLAFYIAPTALNLNLHVSGEGSKKQKFNATVVHFNTFRDSNHGNLLENRVGIYIGSDGLSDSTNASSTRYLVLDSEEKLQTWIDYEVGSRRLEVRLGKDGGLRPSMALLSYPINFIQLFGDEELSISISSSNENSSHKCSLYSWSFRLKTVPKWMHSQPLDPQGLAKNSKAPPLKEKKDCFIRVVAAMFLGTATGALTAFIALYLYTILGSRLAVAPEEFPVGPVDSKYKTVGVACEKSIEDDGEKTDV